MMKSLPRYLLLIGIIIACSSAFVSPSSSLHPSHHRPIPTVGLQQPSITSTTNNNTNLKRSSSTQLHSLFGLGPAELAIIAISALFLIGPSKLSEFTRSAGEIAGKEAEAWKDLKNIPEEFQKGLEEGEMEGRSRRAKVMESVDKDD